MHRGIVMQILKDGVSVCDLCFLREVFVETERASKFSVGDKVYIHAIEPFGKDFELTQSKEKIIKVDHW